MSVNLRVLWPKVLPLLLGLVACQGACVAEQDPYEIDSWDTLKPVAKPKDVAAAKPRPWQAPAEMAPSIRPPPPTLVVGCEFEDEQKALDRMHLLQHQARFLTSVGDRAATNIWVWSRYKQYAPALFDQLSETSTVISPSEERIGSYGIGFLGMRGRRAAMEDRIAVHESEHTQVIALLDGHAGEAVVNAAADILPVTVADFLEDLSAKQRGHAGCVSDAIRRAFDGDQGPRPSVARALARLPQEGSGATALVAVLMGQHVYVANLGRSVALATVGGSTQRVTLDHSAELEAADIRRRGGYVESRDHMPRLNGILSPSRALGDKDLPVGRSPDVVRLEGPLERLVLVSHAVLQSMGSHYIDNIAGGGGHQLSPGLTAEYVVSFAYAAGAQNNLSAVILQQ